MTATTKAASQASLPTPNSTKSFWHSEPSSILLGHRSTDDLPEEADIVIIGSGASGASAAYWLSQNEKGKDLKIVMLEAREACWGATGRNGGHCQPLLYHNPPAIGHFEFRNFTAIGNLISKHSIACDWRTHPVVHAYMDLPMFEHAVSSFDAVLKEEPSFKDLVTVVTESSTSPSLTDLRVPTAKGAMVMKNAASLWPYKLVSWMLESLLSKTSTLKSPNFNLQTNTPVTSLQKDGKGWLVKTPRGSIKASKVLLTTNGYTSHLLPSFSSLIVPVRGEMSALTPPTTMKPGSTSNPPLSTSYGFVGNDIQNINQDDYLIQRPYTTTGKGGELMFGGGRSYAKAAGVGISDDSSIDPPAASYLRQEIGKVLEIDAKGGLEGKWEWSGIMGFSRDDRPWVGEITEERGFEEGGKGLFVSAGFTGHGMPNTCLCAKAVVELMVGKGEEEVDLPELYKVSKERLERAKALEEVAVADAKGEF